MPLIQMKKLAQTNYHLLPVIPLSHMGGSRDSDPVLLPTHTHFPLSDGEITLGAELPQKYKTIWELFTFSSLVFPCFSSLVSWGH